MTHHRLGALAAAILYASQAAAQSATANGDDNVTLEAITVKTAAEELLQAPGSTTITKKVLESRPVANDISEIVRTMPGVNLSGNSNSGQRGNNRQIDLRGMGPENTLILIDGRPVSSRNAVKMGRSGERDTRGDSQWVPPSAIQRIDVLRGPAAARYGSGSMGGVVNIVTKKPTEPTATLTGHYELPQHKQEGKSWRLGANLAGPIGDQWNYRTILGYHKSEGDAPDINAGHAVQTRNRQGQMVPSVAAGREGVENRDFSQLFEYRPNGDHTLGVEAGLSRQGNDYAGDALFQDMSRVDSKLIGTETNVMRRGTTALTHKGNYGFGDSNSYIQYENTKNTRLDEGGAGSVEGLISADENGQYKFSTIRLQNLAAKSEWNFNFDRQTLTAGAEYRGEWMKDATSNQMEVSDITIPGTTNNPAQRNPNRKAQLYGLYLEDNILVGDRVNVTPGLRADYHSEAGFNLSPSLNVNWDVNPDWSIKAGASRAFKAPNLYQLNPDYVYMTRGNGCPYPFQGQGPCYIVGNPNLKHETAFNKEIGFNYHNEAGWNAGMTYFHNDYKNRIAAGRNLVTTGTGTSKAYRWENTPKAVIEGLEGNLNIPLTDNLNWYTNATVMLKSKDKTDNQPLSLVPKYTLNSTINWQVNDQWNTALSATHYGKTKAATMDASGYANESNQSVSPYSLFNFNTGYRVNKHLRLDAGVKNLFDKRIFREGTPGSAGARTFNEAGRTFMLGFTADLH